VKTFVKNAVAGLLFSALFLLVLSVPARSQVLARSVEAAGTIGYDYTSMTSNPAGTLYPTTTHFFGGSGGYNVTPYITALGEYKYDPLNYAMSGVTYHTQISGGAARFNFTPSKKIVPYAIVGAGYDRLTASFSGEGTVFADGYYVNFGGGASVYCGKHWGVRPEVRYERQHVTYEGQTISANVADVSGSFFYQFGGTGKKKK
jgi:hypothetical protein